MPQEREDKDVKVLQMGKRERQGTTKLKAGKVGLVCDQVFPLASPLCLQLFIQGCTASTHARCTGTGVTARV